MAASFCRRSFINLKKSFNFTQCRNGYLVLLPETVNFQSDENPFLRIESLPEFTGLTTTKCEKGMGKAAQDLEVGIWTLEKELEERLKNHPENLDVFEDVIQPLEKLGVPLENTWGLLKMTYLTDQKLMPTENYMTIHDRGRRVRAMKFSSQPIFDVCKLNLSSKMNPEQERVVKKFVLEGSLNGLSLEPNKKSQLFDILKKLGSYRSQMKIKIETSSKLFRHEIKDEGVIREFPVNYLRLIADDPTQPEKGPWNITLQPHILKTFLEYCPTRSLRWNAWLSDVQKCSIHGESSLSTSVDLEEIRSHRQTQASLLGFKTYAHMSMKTKMAESIENVQNILDILLEKAKIAQEQEVNDLEKFALERGFQDQLELWDVPYWKRKQQKSLFQFDEESLRQYFPLSQVLLGLFTLCEQLFSIKIEERTGADTWHPDVRFFRIIDEKSKTNLGGFYIDPYARKGKIRVSQDAGWMVGLRTKSKINHSTPLSALVFNFPEPLYGKPSLLSFKDVDLLFRRFGHTLQHILTETSYSEVAGLSNIEWDAVEVCSNLMRHWLYDRGTLESISSHYETQEPLPSEILENITKIRQHMAGLDLCREIYLSNLDLQLHMSKDFWLDIVKKLWPQHFLFKLDKYDCHPCSFKEIFTEEWAAAYYCHTWSKMVAADVFGAFVDAGLENQQELQAVGNRFRSTFLALGGSCHPSEVFRRFRGRDPSPNALLSDLGLKDITPTTNT